MALTLTTEDYQISQRNPRTGLGDIPVAGTGTVNGATVEARWNNGSWTSLGTVSDGAFSGTLTNQASGQGDLEVRENGGAVADTAHYVGVGSIFVGTGASNMSGRGTSNQSYSHPTLKAAVFKNNYHWAEMVDPTDSYTGQVDTVSKDQTPDAAGSWIPHLATRFMAHYGYPMAYLPCAMGSTMVEDWIDIGTDRATLFGSMAHRMGLMPGGCELVMFMTYGDNVKSYRDAMNIFAENVPTYGCDYVMQIAGVLASGYTPAKRHCIWKEQQNRLALTHQNIVEGPQLRKNVVTDSLHMLSDAELQYAGLKVFEAIKKFKTVLEGGNLRQQV